MVMKKLFTLVLLGGSLLLSAQESSTQPKKNQIEIFYSVSEFFDGSPTNWLFLEKYDNVKGEESMRIPFSVGLRYARRINNSSMLRGSVLLRNNSYPYKEDVTGPQLGRRSYARFSTQYIRGIFKSQWGRIRFLAGVNYRLGYESYQLSDWPLGAPMESISYRDFGLSGGVQLVKPMFDDFFLSLEVTYTRYFWFKYEGTNNNLPQVKYPSPQNLSVHYGVGYRF